MDNLILRKEVSYLALAVCILTNLNPEEAFDRIAPDNTQKKVRRLNKLKETEKMIELRKQGVKYTDIANMFGITKDAVFRRLRRYKERMIM